MTGRLSKIKWKKYIDIGNIQNKSIIVKIMLRPKYNAHQREVAIEYQNSDGCSELQLSVRSKNIMDILMLDWNKVSFKNFKGGGGYSW